MHFNLRKKSLFSKFTFIFLCFLFSNTSLVGQENYRAQITVFEQKVPSNYFSDIGNVKYQIDHNNLYRYYIGGFSSKSEAESSVQSLKSKGYKYATLIDLNDIHSKCTACGTPKQNLFLESIFFDFDKDFLRPESKRQLNTMATVLQNNSNYKAKLTGHTDSKGSNDYNQNLSQRRADNAKNYLMRQGISAEKIIIDFSGEESPIAKNETSGADNPKGRQFNRRVVLNVIDSNGNSAGLVKEIVVPSGLEN